MIRRRDSGRRRGRSSACSVALALVASGATRATGADVLLGPGIGARVQLQIKRTVNPAADSIKFSAKSPAILFTPGTGAVGDPIAHGATAVVFSASDCQCLSLGPAPNVSPGWTPSPTDGSVTSYKWRDLLRRSSARISTGRIKLKKKGGVTYGLDATPQGEVEMQLVSGNSTSTFCARFASPPARTNDSATKYKATSAASDFTACGAVPAFCACAPTTTTIAPTTTTTSVPAGSSTSSSLATSTSTSSSLPDTTSTSTSTSDTQPATSSTTSSTDVSTTTTPSP